MSHAAHDHSHGHSHGLVDRSIVRSRDGLKTVSISLAVLGLVTVIQLAIYIASGSVALLADMVHNFGDALTAVPLGIAFFLRSFRGEKIAGLFVVLAIFVSACVAFAVSVERLLHPQTLNHLGVLAAAGVVGFAGNEIAAQVRLRGGRRLASPALIADGNHARVITVVILKVTWDSWRVVSTTDPGETVEPHRGS
jgi:divalent metal cation (Fe/Co/Zn/Cd) transporter